MFYPPPRCIFSTCGEGGYSSFQNVRSTGPPLPSHKNPSFGKGDLFFLRQIFVSVFTVLPFYLKLKLELHVFFWHFRNTHTHTHFCPTNVYNSKQNTHTFLQNLRMAFVTSFTLFLAARWVHQFINQNQTKLNAELIIGILFF